MRWTRNPVYPFPGIGGLNPSSSAKRLANCKPLFSPHRFFWTTEFIGGRASPLDLLWGRVSEIRAYYGLHRSWGARLKNKKEGSWKTSFFLWRYLAESNCSKRFCRPLPNRSAKVPLRFCVCKITKTFSTSKTFIAIFAIVACLFLLGAIIAAALLCEDAPFAAIALVGFSLEWLYYSPDCPKNSKQQNKENKNVLQHTINCWGGLGCFRDGRVSAIRAYYGYFNLFSVVERGRSTSCSCTL